MQITDTDNSGTVDFNELTHALQKIDLRIEVHDYMLVILRFFVSEMARTSTVLRSKFKAAATKERAAAAKSGDTSIETKPNEMTPDGIRSLLKTLDARLEPSLLQRMMADMSREMRGEAKGFVRRGVMDEHGAATGPVDVDTFVRVTMSNGLHAVSSRALRGSPTATCPSIRATTTGVYPPCADPCANLLLRSQLNAAIFKEMGQALQSTTNALMAVSAFARKLPALTKGKK